MCCERRLEQVLARRADSAHPADSAEKKKRLTRHRDMNETCKLGPAIQPLQAQCPQDVPNTGIARTAPSPPGLNLCCTSLTHKNAVKRVGCGGTHLRAVEFRNEGEAQHMAGLDNVGRHALHALGFPTLPCLFPREILRVRSIEPLLVACLEEVDARHRATRAPVWWLQGVRSGPESLSFLARCQRLRKTFPRSTSSNLSGS